MSIVFIGLKAGASTPRCGENSFDAPQVFFGIHTYCVEWGLRHVNRNAVIEKA
jgi:hypothetical protein